MYLYIFTYNFDNFESITHIGIKYLWRERRHSGSNWRHLFPLQKAKTVQRWLQGAHWFDFDLSWCYGRQGDFFQISGSSPLCSMDGKTPLHTKIDIVRGHNWEWTPKSYVFEGEQRQLVRQFVDFTVLSYIPWWLTSPLSTTASWNDLLLLNSLLEYRKRDPVVANVALKSLKNTQLVFEWRIGPTGHWPYFQNQCLFMWKKNLCKKSLSTNQIS